MANRTILELELAKAYRDGFKLYRLVNGQVSDKKWSNVGKLLIECKAAFPEAEIKVVAGAKRRHATEGTKNAIVYR